MTDRHAGYLVTLTEDVRDDDGAATLAAIAQIRGVLTVTPVISNASVQQIAETRVNTRWRDWLQTLIRASFN